MARTPTTASPGTGSTTDEIPTAPVKTARLHAPGDVRLHDEQDPTPAAGEEIVRVTAVGLCGSDRHWFVEGSIGDAVLARPLVLGHEIAGVIETGPHRGERVALDPADPCGQCDLCAAGRAHLCTRLRFAGHGTTDGGLRTRMAWPARLLAPVPDAIGDDEAALLEPLGVALHALELGAVEPGMKAGVFGCGPIGLLLVQLLRHLGAEPVAANDPLPHRRAAARSFGATTPGPALDVAFEAAGDDGAVDDAIAAVRPAGRVVLVGIPDSDRTTFRASIARRKGLTILLTRRMRADHLQRAIEMAAAGEVDLRSLITAHYPLTGAADAFDDLVVRRGLKVIIVPGA